MKLLGTRSRTAIVLGVLCTNALAWTIANGGLGQTASASDTPVAQTTPAARALAASAPVQTADIRQGIVVVGDSISARYDDKRGSRKQAWWSVTGRTFHAPVRVYAQSGSGYLRPGYSCTGDTFSARREFMTGRPPAVVIVEGGRNDWSRCLGRRFVRASDAQIAKAVDDYFDLLTSRLPQTTRIVVLGPPWGPLQPWEGRRITSIVHTSASRHSLQFISTEGTLDSWSRVLDGVHPNRAGSLAIADRVVRALKQPAVGR